jgi:hypothetical protein
MIPKAELEVDSEYGWQDQHDYGNDHRRVTLVEIMKWPTVRVRDADGDFETTAHRLKFKWSERASSVTESKFRTATERREAEERAEQARDPEGYEIHRIFRRTYFEPGKGGVARVPDRLPITLEAMASGVIKLDMGEYQIVREEQMACYRMLSGLHDICREIRAEVEESALIESLLTEEREGRLGTTWSLVVKDRLSDGMLPFASSEIMPVYASYGMTRSRAVTAHSTGSKAVAEFMERVADRYEELDRYASLATKWAWGFYLRWRDSQEYAPGPQPV